MRVPNSLLSMAGMVSICEAGAGAADDELLVEQVLPGGDARCGPRHADGRPPH